MKLMEGVITPIVTPFNRDKNQTVNLAESKKMVEHLISHGVDGILALGTNGEFHTMDRTEKIEFVSAVIEAADHRLPIYANVGSCSLQESIQLSKEMEKLGVNAVTSVAPYFVQPNEEELYYFFYEIASNISVPLILYNIPKFTGYSIAPSIVQRLVNDRVGVLGIKDSSGDLGLFEEYMKISKALDFKVMIGSDSKISSAFQLGATACVAGTSNLITDTVVSLWQSLKDKEALLSERLQNEIEVLRSALKLGTQPSIIKKGIELSGIAQVGCARKPVCEPNKEAVVKTKKMLKYFGLV
ncbi:MAG: dihydrodipicolinate synthase family protein [Streptococcaceae bacterium]|jgi:4-hydroxy-tetrahydrodipicolinate synthase|nr:dihydrodipicolinate synthase family protein [Streptococcaceae bacterium]